ncbi:MAG: DNA-protecting protein DprA [Planctomycetota bacterium]|nr:MAG: DNA-protecting protein DprA [Planctomycetota bacterium]
MSLPLADVYLRLSLIAGLGPLIAERILAAAGDQPAAIFGWSQARLCAIDGVGPERARRILNPHLDEQVESERARAAALGLRIITRADDDYPVDLQRLNDPPLALWMRGELRPEDRLAVAVVGPRNPSAYGHRQARRLAQGLASLGTCIISGLARGVDTVAHEAALAAGGRTVAVLGSGFDHPYPEENRDLLARIADGRGAVISEFPCPTRPSPGTFPRRNRMVAALSLATLVIEAGKRSGALITARLAGELGKEVMALPGPVDRPEHQGSNQLLRDGATLVTGLEEILAEIPPLATMAAPSAALVQAHEAAAPAARLSGRERDIYALLSDVVRSVDEVVAVSGLPASVIGATMVSLELKRLVRRQAGGFVRAV